MSGFNRSFVGVSRRPCCRSQQRLIFILLVERFDRYCAPNLDWCLLLRRDRDCFADLGRSLCSLSAGLASTRRVICRLCLTLASRAIHILISSCFRARLGCCLGFSRRLEGIVGCLLVL